MSPVKASKFSCTLRNHKGSRKDSAGRYVPYFSAAMLDQNDTEYYDLRGALVYDPCIGQFDYVQQEVPAVPYVLENNNFFNFNQSFIDQLVDLHQSCGYADYIEKYLTFPPSGVQPPVFFNYTSESNCDVFDLIDFAAFDPNPCFGNDYYLCCR
jgi:carboxypeptidase D